MIEPCCRGAPLYTLSRVRRIYNVSAMRFTIPATTACAAALVALVFAAAAPAHHASILIDFASPVWIAGTVVRYERVNPHTLFELDVVENGNVRRWTVEGPFLARLKRMGVADDLLKPGDALEVCGFPLKQGISLQSSSSDFRDRTFFVHGHVLALPNGELRSWGPYGKTDNCVRPGDRAQTWVDFLNGDPLAREAWCDRARRLIPTRAESRALVAAIDRAMAEPCEGAR